MSTMSTNRCGSIFPIPFCFLGRSSQALTKRYATTTHYSQHPVILSWPGNWEQWLKMGMFLSPSGAGETPVMLGGGGCLQRLHPAMLSNQNQFGHILIHHQRNQRLVDKVRDLWKKNWWPSRMNRFTCTGDHFLEARNSKWNWSILGHWTFRVSY